MPLCSARRSTGASTSSSRASGLKPLPGVRSVSSTRCTRSPSWPLNAISCSSSSSPNASPKASDSGTSGSYSISVGSSVTGLGCLAGGCSTTPSACAVASTGASTGSAGLACSVSGVKVVCPVDSSSTIKPAAFCRSRSRKRRDRMVSEVRARLTLVRPENNLAPPAKPPTMVPAAITFGTNAAADASVLVMPGFTGSSCRSCSSDRPSIPNS